MITSLIYVALGGALGATARYVTGLGLTAWLGAAFPYGTLLVNVLGSFLMGLAFVALAGTGGSRAALFVMTGLLGGFTTFSAFSLDVFHLVERGALGLAGLYIAASVLVSLLALFAGVAVMRGVAG